MKIKEEPQDFIVEEIPLRKPGEGKYYLYELKKTSLTTPQAIASLAKNNHLTSKHIRYAGLKDKHAITTQSITATKELTNNDPNIELTLIGKTDEHLHLGELTGNRFIITIKETNEPKKTDKIPNYYGEQRFSTNNVERGLLIAKKQYKELAEQLAEENQEVNKQLINQPNQPIEAIKKVQQKILLIYIHALQSKLWNEAAKKYLEKNPAEQIEFPLIGAVTPPTPYEEYYEETMKKHGITMQDFYNKQIPHLTQEGEMRNLLQTFIEKPTYKKINSTTWQVSFALTTGSYATTSINEWFSK